MVNGEEQNPDDEQRPNWRLYERAAAAFVTENTAADIELSPTINASIIGTVSQVPRQIDVLIEARWETGRSRRVIVDAKRYRDKVDINDVESFLSMMEDCGADRGIFVCPKGWTNGARRRVQDAVSVTLLSEEDALSRTDWARFEDCVGSCVSQSDRNYRGIVLMDAFHSLANCGAWSIMATGKCDVCHEFNIWCWGCGERFALEYEQNYTCDCGFLWSSMVEEEISDATGETLNAVHLLLLGATLVSLDRRSIR